MKIHVHSFLGQLEIEWSGRVPAVQAQKPSGAVWSTGEKVADLLSATGPTRLYAVCMPDRTRMISVDRTSAADGSDVIVEDSALGELVKIECGGEPSFREEVQSGLGFGRCDRGLFLGAAAPLTADKDAAICLVAALCLYFPYMENTLNRSYPSG